MLVRARSREHQRSGFTYFTALTLGLAVLAILVLFTANAARSQTEYPRVGLSASPHEYVDTIDITMGEEFTLYACVFGPGPGEPIGQSFTSLAWVIHQVCCGGQVDIYDFEYNPELEHEGHPLVGVQTTSPTCYDQDSVLLATMTCKMTNPVPGGVLWAAGPYDASHDCEGGNPIFMGMAVTINADGEVLPVEDSRWGSVKAMYR